MMKKVPRPTAVAITVVAASLLLFPAAAYILPFDPLLEQLGEKRKEEEEIGRVFRGKLTFHDVDGVEVAVPATRAVRADGHCRIELNLEPDHELEGAYVNWDGRRAAGSGEAVLEPLMMLETLACPLFALGTHAEPLIRGQVDLLGVDVEQVGYGRLEGKVAYVIGGRSWETHLPQVWLHKETLVPLRALGEIDGRAADVRMMGREDRESGEWHPTRIELYLDGMLAVTFDAREVDHDVDLPASLFR